ncbi:THAP domain-containing protein 1 [Merluccius polli]|nr:THAP domain-containing protein 1 [Merluccius polli]
MSCCAVGCTNRFNKFNKTRKFYRIPSTRTPLKANRRRRWLQAIRRSDWNEQMIKNATICSDHFISDFETSNQVAKQACHIKEYAKLYTSVAGALLTALKFVLTDPQI